MTDAVPTTANRTLPRRQPNAAYRQREYLTEKEVDRLIEAARKRGRNGPRDAAAILLAYRHGLRAAELCSVANARREFFEAMKQVAETGHGPVEQSPSMGCSIKWMG